METHGDRQHKTCSGVVRVNCYSSSNRPGVCVLKKCMPTIDRAIRGRQARSGLWQELSPNSLCSSLLRRLPVVTGRWQATSHTPVPEVLPRRPRPAHKDDFGSACLEACTRDGRRSGKTAGVRLRHEKPLVMASLSGLSPRTCGSDRHMPELIEDNLLIYSFGTR